MRTISKLIHLRTTLPNVLKAAFQAHEAVGIQERNDVGHIPPLGEFTLETFKASALLSRYYLAILLASFSKDKALSLVSYTSVTTYDIAFMWVILLCFATGITWSGKRYSEAKVFIHAVYKPQNIVDLVHGHTEVLKPVVKIVPAPARAASHDSSAEGRKFGSEERAADGSSSSSSSSEDDPPAAVKAPRIKRVRIQGGA